MAGNTPDWRGREYSSRERDYKRAPVRVASKERAPSPSVVAVAAAARGHTHERRSLTSRTHHPPPSHSPSYRPRSTSRDRHRSRDDLRRRPRSPDRPRPRYLTSSHGGKAGERDEDSSLPPEHRRPAPAKRHYRHSPSPSRQYAARDHKRRRSLSRDSSPARSRAYSPQPSRDGRDRDERDDRDDRDSRRGSLDPYPSQGRAHAPRHRSRSADSKYRAHSSKYPRRPSPGDRSRARDHSRDRYRSPPRHGRRRHSPQPPARRPYRDRAERESTYSSHHHYEERHGTRHSKPAARTPSRDLKRSPSPTDLISQLATDRRRDEPGPSRHRHSAHRTRRTSRSPPAPEHSRHDREYRDEARYRGRERDRPYDAGRRDYYNTSPRRDRHRDDTDEEMYGRGGYPRGPPGRPPYVDPRYAQHTPPYAQQGPPAGHSPPHAHSPYGRGGYPPQQHYGSYHGSPAHAYSPQPSPYHYASGYPPPGASPYYQPPPPPAHYAPPQAQHPYPPQPSYPPHPSHPPRPPPRNSSYGPPQRSLGPPPGAGRGRGGHFANLSWTPSTGSRGGKIGNNSTATTRALSNSGGATPAANGPATTASVDDDDNPFRPPKDLRAEDETAKNESKLGSKPGSKPGISFSIKGLSDQRDASPPPAQMRKEIVKRKRLKFKPRLTDEFAASDSVYFRKIGNESVIGSGTYGKVYKAVHVYTNDKVALKKIRMEGERDGFPVTAIREIKLLQSLNHNNVVKLQEVMVERNDCFMVFEYLSHDLTGLLNHPSFTLTSAHKKHLAQQLFEGLDYLHKRGVLHRDIKAANILVSRDGELKLADFGLARFYNKNAKKKQDYTNRVITIWYRSPELLLGETQYGPSVDVWSAACVLVEIFTRHAIFPGDGGEINQLDKIYNVLGTPSREQWPGITDLAWYELLRPTNRLPSTFAEKYKERVSPAAFDLLSAMFQYDPNARPSASDVLEHPYFTAEEPKAQRAWGLKDLEGDWHEFESKALRKEKEREARRKDRENAEQKRKPDATSGIEERENKRPRTSSDVRA